MPFQEFMSKIRHWDNRCSRWMMRHFYILFFEFVLVAIFFAFFFSTLKAFDLSARISGDNVMQQIALQQLFNIRLIVILLLLNSFWMLYIFNGMSRLRSLLKEICFQLSKTHHHRRDS